ncbi:MAG: 30S ribosomal protein S1 [Rickettsiales bacterium]|jgi:small subunit ribosomal protein S1|nr:30S ribosomal protein S1 [Rickettsiales bacterium]|tara:strand:- start:1507 stop:3330 length:1824 start_codon:yes stop_codon:yes gene_type:complete
MTKNKETKSNIKDSKDLDLDTNQLEANFGSENFAQLFEEFEKDNQKLIEGGVVKGVIVEISEYKGVAIDIGAKSIGYIDPNEFKRDGEINEGNVVDVYLHRLENKRGELIISRENARRYISWNYLRDCMESKTNVEGKVLGRVKGGYAVDIDSIICFLPRSQVDTMLLSDDEFLINKVEKLNVLKIDDIRGNVVVSRRSIIEAQRNAEKDKVLAKIKVGDSLDGTVKNITDYGAFIDFGSFDGLLHLTDISWCRVRHPSEVLKVGQEVKVQVIKYDENSKRVSLGMKQLQENPWESIAKRYPVGSITKGKVTNITSYGAFVEIESGIEGLVHISEISWMKNVTNPNKLIAPGQDVEVMILDINATNHRISLGVKQCKKNPWQEFSESHKVGDLVKGKARDLTDFGLFVEFDSGIEGLVHVSDIADEINQEEIAAKYNKDTEVDVIILGINYEKERISLGIKQVTNKKFTEEISAITENSIQTCAVTNVKKDYIEVELDCGIKGVIKRLDISKNKNDQKTEKFEVGDRIDAKVSVFNKTTGKLLLSIKNLEIDAHEDHIYSPSDSETSIANIAGDVLGSITFDEEDNSKKEQKKDNDKKASDSESKDK